MHASTIAIWIICVVGVAGLLTWVTVVRLAARRPHEPNPQRGQMRGLVQGGMHVGGGRSVAPHRDAPVPEGGGEPPSIEEELAAHEGSATQDGRQDHASGNSARGKSGSPMDL
jgi:hypothetical protein